MELKLNRTHIRHAVPLQALGGLCGVGERCGARPRCNGALGGLVVWN